VRAALPGLFAAVAVSEAITVDHFESASEYIERLDPLYPAPRRPEQTPRQSP
jgi:hypothetical protein